MRSKLSDKSIDKTPISIGATASTALIGLCATIITLLITLLPQQLKTNEFGYVLAFFVFAMIFFIFSTEFYTLAAWKDRKYHLWWLISSTFYGLGTGWLILGVSLALRLITPFTWLAYLFLFTYLACYIFYYVVRLTVESETSEGFSRIRWFARGLIFGQMVC